MLGHLCLLMVLIKDRLLSSHEDWELGALSFLMIKLQKDDSQVLEKDIVRKKEL